LIPLIGLLIGLVIGLFVSVPVPAAWAPYLALMVLAGIDTLLAVLVRKNESQEYGTKFLLEFLVNSLMAMLLTALGQQINFELSTIIAFVFTYRIFINIREIVSKLYLQYKDWRLAGRKSGGEIRSSINDEEDKG